MKATVMGLLDGLFAAACNPGLPRRTGRRILPVPKGDAIEERADMVVVGGGIMGRSIARTMIGHGWDVRTIDDADPLNGTLPCGGSVKPSPLTGIPPEEMKPILDRLEALYGLHKERFQIRPSMGMVKADVWQVSMKSVWAAPNVTRGTVCQVDWKPNYPLVWYHSPNGVLHRVTAGVAVVTAGARCDELFPDVFPPGTLYAKQGISFRFPGTVEQAWVEAWAPYKQVTIHNIDREDGAGWETWASDGTALLQEGWGPEREEACLTRIRKGLGTAEEPRLRLTGLRPFHRLKPKPCFVQQLGSATTILTGAGKFGCISAGWAANHVARTLGVS